MDFFRPESEVNLIKFSIVKTVCFVDLLSSLVNIRTAAREISTKKNDQKGFNRVAGLDSIQALSLKFLRALDIL